jgi:predicted transcriptional regulator
MDSSFLSRKRGSLAITIAILKAAKEGAMKTQLLYTIGMSYDQLSRYLEFLNVKDFIERNGNLLKTTDKGLELIEEFESSPLTQSIVDV